MASLAIGAIGAAIGSTIGGTFLGMSAAAWGWNVGLTVGGMLFAPKAPDQRFEGPRLSDLKVQASTYGNPIPQVFGRMRLAGNVIWSLPIKETSHTSTSGGGGGGKGGGGGGGGSVTTTTYSYSQSFAVAVCEGPITGIRRIWASGKLIYDLSTTSDVSSAVATARVADAITIYLGSETQNPDPIISADVGAANTPAYRGTAYVVFDDLDLTEFGNRMPNLEFEVIDSGTAIAGTYEQATIPATIFAAEGWAYGNGRWLMVTSSGGRVYSSRDGLSYSLLAADTMIRGPLRFFDGYFYAAGIAASAPYVGGAYRSADGLTWSLCSIPFLTVIDFFAGDGVVYMLTSLGGLYLTYRLTSGAFIAPIGLGTSQQTGGAAGLGMVVIASLNGAGGTRFTRYQNGTISESTYTGFGATSGNVRMAYGAGRFIACCNNKCATSTDGQTWTAGSNLGLSSGPFDLIYGAGWFAASGGVGKIAFTPDGTNITTVSVPTFGGAFAAIGLGPRGFFGGGVSTAADGPYNVFPGNFLSDAAMPLASVISTICERAGLTASDYDVSGLSGSVTGYTVQQATARAMIEPLASAYFFDSVESDGKVKFVARGGASVATIDSDDLAAHLDGETWPDALVSSRQQEMELPVSIDMQYFDADANYAIGTQRSQRLTTDSRNKSSINAAIAMTGDKAKQVADVLMYVAWSERASHDFASGWKYAYLEPTDVITLNAAGRSYTMRLTSDDFAVGVSRRTAVTEDAAVYSQSAAAAPITAPTDAVSSKPVTRLALMDIPLLRDQDDGIGFYAAACGFGAGWTGAQVFKSTDGGITFDSFGTPFLSEAVLGDATTALGNWARNIVDETNSVTVTLERGELSSVTELQMLNGANAAMLGDEIIQFRDATLVGEDTYTLTGLLRGRLGTEWARSTHAAGDRFALLSYAALRVLPAAAVEYGVARHYKGGTFGGLLDDAYTQEFTHNAVAQMPYAPVHVSGGRNAAGDITVIWMRRSRVNNGWNNYGDVPIGETTEAYELDVYADGTYATVLRTISASTTSASYTAAQQTTDFGSPQATLYVGVYQMSATVGRGREQRGVI